MSEQQLETLRAEKLPEAVNTRRALGRGLGALLMHRRLCVAGRQSHALREPVVPRGLPSWARGFYLKAWRLGRKT